MYLINRNVLQTVPFDSVGRSPNVPKHSFRFLFKGGYGPTKLRYPLFGDSAANEFDTVILDDVLDASERPVEAINEARRVMRPGGRILALSSIGERSAGNIKEALADWCRASELRLSTPRAIPTQSSHWILAVLTLAETTTAAA